MGYDFDIVYKPRRSNKAIDALSRPPKASMMAISTRTFDFVDKLYLANKEHPELLAIQSGLDNEPTTYPDFSFQGRIIVFSR